MLLFKIPRSCSRLCLWLQLLVWSQIPTTDSAASITVGIHPQYFGIQNKKKSPTHHQAHHLGQIPVTVPAKLAQFKHVHVLAKTQMMQNTGFICTSTGDDTAVVLANHVLLHTHNQPHTSPHSTPSPSRPAYGASSLDSPSLSK